MQGELGGVAGEPQPRGALLAGIASRQRHDPHGPGRQQQDLLVNLPVGLGQRDAGERLLALRRPQRRDLPSLLFDDPAQHGELS